MHISNMLKMFRTSVKDSGTTTTMAPAVQEQPVPTTTDENTQPVVTKDDYSVLMDMIKNINRQNEETTNLTQDEVGFLLDQLIKFHDKYFSMIPVVEELSKGFIWNIPPDILKATRDCVDKEMPDIYNPMLLFYIFFVEDDGFAFPKFLQIIRDMLIDDDNIDHLAKVYENNMEEYYNTTEEEYESYE